MSKSVEQYLNEVNYSDNDIYTPTLASTKFVNFIKLVNGAEGEENKTPIAHYRLMDKVFSKSTRLAVLCHRGFSKSTLLSEYLLLYVAVFGVLDNFGVVDYALFVGDSAENGCRNVRKNMENRYNNSSFLLEFVPKARFTDTMIEFSNKDGKQFAIKLVGAQQSIRGTRFNNKRPQLAICDDILTDADAKSPTCISNVENTIYKAVSKALHPDKNKICYIGTVFSAGDPLYKAVESDVWDSTVFPVCESFPCEEKDFRGSWPDRFPYKVVKAMYDEAIGMGRVSDFNSEMMNRIMSNEDRVISDSEILWYERKNVMANRSKFNFYITTDFATSERTSGDFSVISVWAYNNNGDWFWVDGVCKRQLMSKNIDCLFTYAQRYKPQSVGVEVSGQQGGFIQWIQNEMMNRNIYFSLASEGNNQKPGIRPNTNKMARFNIVEPLFKLNKIYFPIELKTGTEMLECINELSLISVQGFKSKHDDFIDTISMLASLTVWKPSEETPVEYNSGSDIWEVVDDNESKNHLTSYIV